MVTEWNEKYTYVISKSDFGITFQTKDELDNIAIGETFRDVKRTVDDYLEMLKSKQYNHLEAWHFLLARIVTFGIKVISLVHYAKGGPTLSYLTSSNFGEVVGSSAITLK